MTILEEIRENITKIQKNGDKPDIIWLGKEERREIEALLNNSPSRDVKSSGNNDKFEIMGLPVMFVSESNWISVSKAIW